MAVGKTGVGRYSGALTSIVPDTHGSISPIKRGSQNKPESGLSLPIKRSTSRDGGPREDMVIRRKSSQDGHQLERRSSLPWGFRGGDKGGGASPNRIMTEAEKSPSKRLPPPSRMKSFDEVVQRLDSSVGRMQVSGRYHRQPLCLEDHYDLEEEVLGVGLHGSVRLVRSRKSGKRGALKDFEFAGVSASRRAQFEVEVEIFLGLDHPHVARLVDVYESNERLQLVMECMEGGELFERIAEKKRFSEEDTAEMTWQMLLALNYLHSMGTMHGDVKLENFMFESKDNLHLKLIDFGFSKMKGQHSNEMACGTVAYIAPEVLDLNFGTIGDMWSLGVIVFVMLSGYMPFSGTETKQLQHIMKGKYSMKKERWETISPDAIDFVKNLLRVDPLRRLTAEAALEHPFIVEREFDTRLSVDSSVATALCEFGRQSRFRRCCMHIMAWSLAPEERREVRESFLALSQKHTGRVTFDELRSIMVERFHVPERDIRPVFEALSVHADQKIHYSDFLAAMLSTRLEVHNDLLQECFQKFDTKCEGIITQETLAEVLGEKFNGDITATLLDDVSTVNPGKMSWHEFVMYMKGQPLTLRGDELLPETAEVEHGIMQPPPRRSFGLPMCGGGSSAKSRQQDGCAVQ